MQTTNPVRSRVAALALPALAAVLLAAPVAAQVEDHRRIEFRDLPDFKIPRPEVLTLDNGMQVFLMPDRELPLISVTARIRGGAYSEPADKAGLAALFGQVHREGGTATRSGDELNDFLENRAASVETGMTNSYGTASMSCLAEDFDAVFAVFNDVLRNPAFAEDKLELAKLQAKTGIARRNDDPSSIAAREFDRAVYGPDSALGRMMEYATLANVGRDDLVAWHRAHYHPNNVMLGVLGDFDVEAMKKKIRAAYADWKPGPAVELDAPEHRDGMTPGVYFVPRDDVTQAYIQMGHLGMRVQDPDYHAAQVMNEILSGGFAARLFSNIRTKRGLAYNVGGGVGASYTHPGLFRTSMSTKSETMAESVEALRDQIRGMIETPVTDEELRRAKESILNSFVFNYDTRSEILAQQMTYAFYGLPKDFLETFRAKIESVTKDEVMQAARRLIKPDNLTLLVVGNPAGFDRPMSTFGEVVEVDVAIAPPPSTAPAVEATAENLEAGRALHAKVADAVGLDGPLQSAASEVEIRLDLGGQQMALGQTITVVLPDKLRQALRTPMGAQVVVLNGKTGYVSAGGQRQTAPAPVVEDLRHSLERNLLVIAAAAGRDDLRAVAGARDEDLGCRDLALTLGGTESRLCVDDSGRPVKQTYQGKHPVQQTPGTVEIWFSDWVEMDGVQLPATQVLHFEGNEVATVTVRSVEVNGETDPALFALE